MEENLPSHKKDTREISAKSKKLRGFAFVAAAVLTGILVLIYIYLTSPIRVVSSADFVRLENTNLSKLQKLSNQYDIMKIAPQLALIDVREKPVFLQGHIQGSLNISLEKIKKGAEFSSSKWVAVYSDSYEVSRQAADIIGKQTKVYLIKDNYKGLTKAGLKIEDWRTYPGE